VVKVLFVTPTLLPSGAARRLMLLVGAVRSQVDPTLVVLGAASSWSEALQAKGVRVAVIPWKRALDVSPARTLRALAAVEQPDIVHVHGWPALAMALLGGVRPPSRLVASNLLADPPAWTWLPEWLLRRLGRVVAFGQAETLAYQRQGVSSFHLTTFPLAVEVPAPAQPARWPDLPDSARVILGVGPLARERGFREAVWMFDIVRHSVPDLHMVLLGRGTDRERVERFARALRTRHLVHFPGEVPEVEPWLERAELVWIPSLTRGGSEGALEAMAAGRAILASRIPALSEVVVEGETGLLAPPGDKPTLARLARKLLGDPTQTSQMGEAGRQRAREFFPPEQLARVAGDFYTRSGTT
jgi:glycosyltransferase involved in cell wall biosynthesis